MSKELFLEYETGHFYFDIYKAWTAHGQAMFRAGTYIKKGNHRKYVIDYRLFAEWDYKNAEDAFEHAKEWLMESIELLIGELKEQINLTPCDVCLFHPPSSADGKPCGYCPATGKDVE